MLCELDYLVQCPVCGHTSVQITRVDKNNNISTIRKINNKAIKFFEKIKSKILYEEEKTNSVAKHYSRFYLYYNEYGVRKKCYSNLKNLKLGLRSLI